MKKARVMVVDDSLVFRSQIRNCLEELADVEVVHLAKNGAVALDYLKDNEVDIMTLDLEMPQMDGLATLTAMADLAHKPKVIVFSANTSKGAQKTLEAMRLGAVDVVCKPSQESTGQESVKERIGVELIPKLTPFVEFFTGSNTTAAPQGAAAPEPRALEPFVPAAVIIGSSTGGPVALESLLGSLPSALPCPVIIAQHMPPLFTKSLAKRLAVVTGKDVKEAQQGEKIAQGMIYIAPGDYHLEIAGKARQLTFELSQKEKRNSVRPAIDFLFESAAEKWGKDILAFILTGMGSDGRDGCKAVKSQGGTVVIQDKESSVVWGMPGAVHQSGDYCDMLPIDGCATLLTSYLTALKKSA